MSKTKETRKSPPRPSARVIRGIRALCKPQVAAAYDVIADEVARGETRWPLAARQHLAPNGMVTIEEMNDVIAAVDYARVWETWSREDAKRQLRATRARAAALRARVAS